MLFCKKFSKIQNVRVQVTPASCQIMYQVKDDNSIRRSGWNVTGYKWKVIMERGHETLTKWVHLTTHTCIPLNANISHVCCIFLFLRELSK
jgi:hypothetical protein